MVLKPTKLVSQKKRMYKAVSGNNLSRFHIYPLILTMSFLENACPTAISSHNLDILCNRKFPDVSSELSYSFNNSTSPLPAL